MKSKVLKRLTAAACAAVLAASLALPAAAYESKCPRCPGTMIGTPIQPTCIDDGYIYLECPDCHATGTAHGAISELENRGNHYGHDYGSSGICSRCGDDARPPQTRSGLNIDPSYLTGEDGHTHDYKLMRPCSPPPEAGENTFLR